jgi:hypothetical protein
MNRCKWHGIRKTGWGLLVGIVVAILILGYIVRRVIDREER